MSAELLAHVGRAGSPHRAPISASGVCLPTVCSHLQSGSPGKGSVELAEVPTFSQVMKVLFGRDGSGFWVSVSILSFIYVREMSKASI